jgi:hypothetical protein
VGGEQGIYGKQRPDGLRTDVNAVELPIAVGSSAE